jgi:hypothetical protein
VAAITANSIRLNLGATNATGYQVKVATSAADLANALWQNVTGNSFTINAAASTEYFYQVQALNGGLTSAASVPASSWTLAAPVAAMPTASNLTDTGLTLNWAAGGATSYTVERATNANFTRNLVITTGVTAGSLDVVGLTANTRYFFRVVALNGAGTPAQASPVLSEVTMAKAPTAVAGINGRPGGPVTAGLNFAGGVATTYNIRWADNSGMVGATSIVRARNATQYPMAGVAASNTANVWMQLQAVNSANVAGAWTPASPIPVIAR